MARKKLIVGNWKMHLTVDGAKLLITRLDKQLKKIPSNVEVVLCPPMLSVDAVSKKVDRNKYKLGVQNIYHKDEGAFTGEVSAAMVRGKADYAIIGHSERRHIFGEKEEIALKVAASIRNGIIPILCVGETLIDRQNGETSLVLHDQLTADLAMITSEDVGQIVIAYEPVWAIGSGDFARKEQVQSAIETIRKNISELYGRPSANKVKVLYGGSVTPDVSGTYLKTSGVDGLLVGGASLNYHHFSDIISSAGAKKAKN